MKYKHGQPYTNLDIWIHLHISTFILNISTATILTNIFIVCQCLNFFSNAIPHVTIQIEKNHTDIQFRPPLVT